MVWLNLAIVIYGVLFIICMLFNYGANHKRMPKPNEDEDDKENQDE